MAYHSKYSGAEVDALLDKIKDDDVGNIDSSLSTTSENPVMNKVITEELNKKLESSDVATIKDELAELWGRIEEIENEQGNDALVVGDTLVFGGSSSAQVIGETLKL